jgi:hypothetical protein
VTIEHVHGCSDEAAEGRAHLGMTSLLGRIWRSHDQSGSLRDDQNESGEGNHTTGESVFRWQQCNHTVLCL